MKNAFDASKIFAGASASALVLAAALVAASLPACRAKPSAGADAGTGDPMRCAACHATEFAEAKRTPHAGVRPATCGVCHTETAWQPSRVDHPWWVLTGAHARAAADTELAGVEKQVKCTWCHRGEPSTFKDTKQECIACHAADREKSSFPGHAAFAETCQDCHSAEAWKPTTKVVSRPAEIVAAGAVVDEDAGAGAGAGADGGAKDAGAPKPKPKPRPKPKPPELPPDFITHPSRHGR